jgi:hypothetical protein
VPEAFPIKASDNPGGIQFAAPNNIQMAHNNDDFTLAVQSFRQQ